MCTGQTREETQGVRHVKVGAGGRCLHAKEPRRSRRLPAATSRWEGGRPGTDFPLATLRSHLDLRLLASRTVR